MLDTQIGQTKSRKDKGILHGKRVIVLGANSGFGRSAVRALGASGAQVVAADATTEGLDNIGRAVPLVLKGAPEEALRRVGRQWGEARLDAVLNLMPVRHPDQLDMNIDALRGVVQAFMPTLAAHGGQIVSVVSQPEQALDVGAGAMGPALLSAQSAFVNALRRDGLTLNMVTFGGGPSSAAHAAVIGLLGQKLGRLNGSDLRV